MISKGERIMDNEKKEIWLADLYHKQQSVKYFPLGIGYIASYAQKIFPDKYVFRLFTDTDKFARQCFEGKPSLLGMRNDIVNAKLSYEFIVRLKKRYPDTIIVIGGPDAPADPKQFTAFLRVRPLIDFFIFRDGEIPFSKLLEALEAVDFNVAELKQSKKSIPGCNYLCNDKLISGEPPPRVKPEEVPSPYLTGIFDQFFKDNSIPAIQSTRGCPFSCAYCTEGHKYFNKVQRFSLERVGKEVQYIAERIEEPSGLLFIVDANFGMYKEDLKIAQFIAEIQKNKGWPGRIYDSGGGKNNKDNVLATFKSFAPGSVIYNSSLQSTDLNVLKNVKRNNISLSFLQDIALEAKNSGLSCCTELILGLPGDSKESHINSLKMAIEMGMQQIFVHNWCLLPGSELHSDDNRQKFQIIPSFSIPRRGLGVYEFGSEIFSCAETIEFGVVNATMTVEDYIWCRMFDITMVLFYNNGYLYESEALLKQLSLSVFDFIQKCHTYVFNDPNDALTQFYTEIKSSIIETTWEKREDIEKSVLDKSRIEKYADMEYIQRFEILQAIAIIKYGKEIHNIAQKALTEQLDEKGLLNEKLKAYINELFRFSLYRKNDFLNTECVFEDEFQFDFEALYSHNFSCDPLHYLLHRKKIFRFAHQREIANAIRKFYNDPGTPSMNSMKNIIRYFYVGQSLDRYFRNFETNDTYDDLL
jgi:radical SAM superfamily enzyme YgiQ (UPF0313 family)